MKKTNIQNLNIYTQAFDISNQIWKIVIKWDWFVKDTLGKQLVRAVDSVALNISEGYGRFHYLENRKFCFYARGSLQETLTCIEMAFNRNLITEDVYSPLVDNLNLLGKKLNSYISSINTKFSEAGNLPT